jgi:hypothetical protein
MDDLTRAVVAKMAELNTPIGPDDPPYPASLTPIAEAVIGVVREQIAADIEAEQEISEATREAMRLESTRFAFDQQAWAFKHAARIARRGPITTEETP